MRALVVTRPASPGLADAISMDAANTSTRSLPRRILTEHREDTITVGKKGDTIRTAQPT
jgi:hypothetical protein